MTSINPQSVHRFRLEIEGIGEASFDSVSGLMEEVEMEAIPEGGQNTYVLQVPSRIRQNRLVLKRGLINGFLWNWFNTFNLLKVVERKNITVSQLNIKGEACYEWTFYGAFPVKWDGPAFSAMNSAISFESIEFVHNGMTMKIL